MTEQSVGNKFSAQSIVFDLFHTIIDPDDLKPKEFQAEQKISEVFGLDAKDFAKYWSELSHVRNTTRSKKPIDLVEDYIIRNTRRHPTKGDLVLVDTLLGRYQDLALQNPKHETVAALHNLKFKGIKLGLLSNNDTRDVATWYRSPLSGLFDAVCFSFDIGCEKPSREAYSAVLNRLGSSVDSSAYVGHGEDLRGAKEAGFRTVIFMEGYVSGNGARDHHALVSQEEVSDLTIQRISELEETLKLYPTARASH
jgi:FMN phosphatase YigB (HAD superfamily)